MQAVDIGKPTPGAINGEIEFRWDAKLLTIPTGEYTVAVIAVGPGGESRTSPSTPFAWTAPAQGCTGAVTAIGGVVGGDVNGEWFDFRVNNTCGNETHREVVRLPRVSSTCTALPRVTVTLQTGETQWYELTVTDKCKVVRHRKSIRIPPGVTQ
jgi:hypothetical protein